MTHWRVRMLKFHLIVANTVKFEAEIIYLSLWQAGLVEWVAVIANFILEKIIC